MSGTMTVGVGRANIELEKLETLLVDGEFTLSRGTWGPGRTPALLLSPTFEHPSPATLTRLEHKFSLRDEIATDWAVRPLALVRPDGLPTLVLEDPGGELLVQRMGRPWETSSFLRVAIALAAALGHLHAQGIVHRDIKPANVVVDILKGKVWLSGFGIASRLPRERRPAEPPEVIAGTLAYMAPEQTGRMNRSIDSRADLYSFGITLYEMLTGTLPFDAPDPMGWVHCHIAKQPPPVSQRASGAPAQIEAIVDKLMAKSAEARYQTAAGVEADLRRCLASWQADGQIQAFPIGEHDISDKLLIPENLYGRESDIAVLLDAFDRVVATGSLEFVLVSGYSGIGKSSVVNELQKPLVPPRGLFAMGKFDQYKRDIPYATLAQALQGLVRMILAGSESEIVRWREAILSALGAHGQLVVDLIPELEIVIGSQPPVPELPPQDAQTRFQMIIHRFLGAFARPEHPLALFLDDLQWLDPATLSLLENLVTKQELQHILVIGAFRDNEVDPFHPLSRSLATIRKSGAHLHELHLGPLTLDDIGHLLLAGQFYAARGIGTVARAYQREACHAYSRWGAHGKVRQLERHHPHLIQGQEPLDPTSTIGAPVENLDWETVVKLSQALSSEILLDKWIHVLMTLALEHAGAQRGILLVPQRNELEAIAEAITDSNGIRVRVVSGGDVTNLPESLFRYVNRTRERVLLEDASAPNPFSTDPYFAVTRCRSVLCLPLVKQRELIGLLYLENNLAPRAFSPQRSALLELVASHAAVSLDHAQLFARLEQRLAFERFISDLSADIGESPADALDERISSWLDRLARILDIDRVLFFEYSAETDRLRCAAFWCPPDQRPPPPWVQGDTVPVAVDHLRRNETYRYETSAEMPPSDRWIYDRVGIRSILGLPVSVEGVGLGCLFLGAVRDERHWPDEMVPRLRVIADILANALARKHAQRDRKVQRELAQALEFRELVMGILSHDLRSPLGAASGLVQLVLRHEGLPEVLRRRVAAVSHSMDRMNDLIGTLLDFTESRFKGGVTIARTTMDLRRACDRVVDEQLAESPGRTIQERCDGPLEGDWDPVRIEQVLSNLLSNGSIKHGDPARPVEVTLRSECGDVAVLEVTNFGARIPPEILGQLFEPFRRGPTSEPGGRRGLGLGLYIVRQIALAHGGSVEVESTIERGTRFTVRLPRKSETTSGPPRRPVLRQQS